MKIAVLVSGGVDSSVALRLLQEQGHDLTAFYLKIWLEDELAYLGNCPWEDDLAYVTKVCEQANVPLHVVSLQKEYWDKVVAYTVEQVRQGRTPSPDVLCNQHIKFGCFYDHIKNDFEKVATGHYAQLEERDGLFFLKKAKDSLKDQTYFLSQLNQHQLSRALFPIGHLAKTEVRALASQYMLPNKDRKDSQGICFLGKIAFSEFIKHHLGVLEGDLIEHETGAFVGKHQGFWYFTIGQRQGIGLSGGPWYVVSKDTAKNNVYISRNYFATDKQRNSVCLSNFHWISGMPPKNNLFQIKLRHGEFLYRGSLEFIDASHGCVYLDGQDQGIAPGQFAVFYDGDYCLGSAVIE
jgi:tRNA (5-methylaminomethyl-2-thiouridylate)-methyltransferase